MLASQNLFTVFVVTKTTEQGLTLEFIKIELNTHTGYVQTI